MYFFPPVSGPFAARFSKAAPFLRALGPSCFPAARNKGGKSERRVARAAISSQAACGEAPEAFCRELGAWRRNSPAATWLPRQSRALSC